MPKKLNAKPSGSPALPSLNQVWNDSASSWVAMSGNQDGSVNATGKEITFDNVDVTASGSTTLKTASASQIFRLHAASYSVSATLSGTLSLKLGAQGPWKAHSPIPGGTHVLFKSDNYVKGSAGSSISVAKSGGVRVSLQLETG